MFGLSNFLGSRQMSFWHFRRRILRYSLDCVYGFYGQIWFATCWKFLRYCRLGEPGLGLTHLSTAMVRQPKAEYFWQKQAERYSQSPWSWCRRLEDCCFRPSRNERWSSWEPWSFQDEWCYLVSCLAPHRSKYPWSTAVRRCLNSASRAFPSHFPHRRLVWIVGACGQHFCVDLSDALLERRCILNFNCNKQNNR